MSVKLLLLDIETAPSLGYVWGKYDQNVIEFKESWFILSFAWKWLGEKEVSVRALCDYKSYIKDRSNDKPLLADLWKLLDEADIIIAHNGDAFDVKRINARLVLHGFPPPSTYKTVDTLKIARRNFKFDSAALKDLAVYFNVGEKLPHQGFKTWKGCMEGDKTAWEVMKEYNQRDITILERIYLLLRPWGAHPDLRLYSGTGCPTCGSLKIQRRGLMHLKTRSYQRLNCQGCGSWFKGDYVKK